MEDDPTDADGSTTHLLPLDTPRENDPKTGYWKERSQYRKFPWDDPRPAYLQSKRIRSKFSDALPNDYEHNTYEGMKEIFAEEYKAREAKGHWWPCLFGELMMTRKLRIEKSLAGDGRPVLAAPTTIPEDAVPTATAEDALPKAMTTDQSNEGISRLFKSVKELELDPLMEKLTKIYEGVVAENRLVRSEDIPYYEEYGKPFTPCTFNSHLTPLGDCVSYLPMVDANTEDLMAKGLFEKHALFSTCAQLMQLIEIDALSRKQGRMVKLIVILDLHGRTATSSPAFDKQFFSHKYRLDQVLTHCIKETYIINIKWYMKLYCDHVVPPPPPGEMRKFLTSDGMDDSDLMKVVSGMTLKKLQETRIAGEKDDVQEDGSTRIGRHAFLEKAIEVKKGDKVTWHFTIGEGFVLLPSPEVEFSVAALWFDKDLLSAVDTATWGRKKTNAEAVQAEKIPETATGGYPDNKQKEADAKSDTTSEVDETAERIIQDWQEWDPLVVEKSVYNSLDEDVTGAVVADQDGCLLFRWSNLGSLRVKSIEYSINSSTASTLDILS